MAIAITPVTRFKHLNGDPNYSIKPGGVGREREVIADIAITSGTTYSTNGITVDFSGAGLKFKHTYLCDVIQGHGGLVTEYVPSANDISSTGKIKLYGKNSGSAATAAATGTVTCATVLENTFSTATITCSTVLENTFADGTVTCVSAIANDTVNVNGLVYTGVAGAKANDTEFSIDTSDTACATDLADSIDDDTRVGLVSDLTATNSSGVVTIVSTALGVGGNAVALSSSDGGTLAVSAANLTGGVDADTVTVNGLVYTAVAGARANDTEFSTDTSNNATATDLAAAITADVRSGTSGDVTASETSAVVTCTTDVAGTAGDAITIVSSDGGTLAVTGSGNFTSGVDADTFTVNGLVYTAVAGARANDTEFSTDTSDTACALDLAAAITADVRTGTDVASVDQTATSNVGLVTITADTLGQIGNSIGLSSTDGSTLAVSGANMTGGVGGDISGFDELENGDSTIQGLTLRVTIRGI